MNSVPDQYLGRVGGTVPVWKGFAATLAWRVEGLPRYDLIGPSNGFRRPGTSMFVEPGVSYSQGSSTVSFNVPLAYYYNRRPDPNTGLEGDATFPREIFLTSYSWRFGGKSAPGLQPTSPPAPAGKVESGPSPESTTTEAEPAATGGSQVWQSARQACRIGDVR